MRFFLPVLLAFFCFLPSTVFAACASPTGTAGQIIYNADHAMPQYCDGTNWIGFGGASGGSGPVAYWKLDETSGTTVADSAGGYTGTWQFAATNDPVTGVIGNAMYTGWARQIQTAGPVTELDNASQASISVWMRRTAAGEGEYVGRTEGFESTEFGIEYFGGDVLFTVPDASTNGTWDQGVYALNDTNWHHLVLVFDGTQTGNANRLKGYVDGAEVSLTYTDTIGSTITASAPPFVIGDDDAVSDTVYIDDVRVYNRALSATEVSGLYNAAIRGAGPTPIAHWALDESSGTTAEDSIGTNDGTLTGNSVTWQSAGGRVDGALQFGGTYDYIVKTGATGLPALRSNLTISAWYYLTATPVNWGYVASLVNQGANAVTRLGIGNTGAVAIGKYGASSGIINTAATPSLNAWHLYTYTFDGTTNRLYIDGVEVGSSTNLPDNATPDEVYIGNDGYQSDATQFTGKIDDVKIYDRALSAAEVAALYDVTDCHGPAGEAGTIIFNANHSVLQYCNGSEWIAVDAGGSPSYMSGLVGHWKLDDGTGTTATDSAGSNDGTLTNGPVWQPSGGHDGGGAVEFDGTNDYITSAGPGFLSNFTVSVWVKSPVVPGTGELNSIVRNRGRNFEIRWDSTAGNAGTLGFTTGGGSYQGISYGTIGANTWYHIVGTWDGTTLRSYNNGVFVTSSTPGSVPADDSSGVMEKGRNSDFGGYFNGLIDDVRVWDRALNAGEVADLYNASAPAMPTPMAMWKFDEGSGTAAEDSIGGNDGTLTNGPTWGTGMFGGAVDFPTSNDVVVLPSGLAANKTQMTVTAWVNSRTAVSSSFQPIYSESHASNCGDDIFSLYLYDGNSGTAGTDLWLEVDTTAVAYSGQIPLSDNTWYFVAGVFDSVTDVHKVYINDTEYSISSAQSTVSNTAVNARIGNGAGTCTTNPFNGLIDNVQVYDTALTAAQIRSLYRAAACSGPTGAAGTMLYNTTQSKLQYCNGTNWVGVGK